MEKTMNNGQGTLIGALTHIKGNLQGDEDLNIIGRVDGTISLSKTLVVESTGVVVADVKVLKAVISGTVVGNITADELVHITEEGRVVGDISAPRVVLVEGASFRGNVDMGDLEAPPRAAGPAPTVRAASTKPAAAAAPRPAARPAARPAPPPPRPAPPPKRVVPVESKPARPAARKPDERKSEPAVERKPEPERKPDTVERRAEPQAPATRVPPPPRPVGAHAGEPPRPPTTAGKKAKARRR